MGGPQITLYLLRADSVLLDGGIALPLDVTHDAIVEALSDLEARCGPLRAGAVMVARWGTHARAADYRGNRHDGGRTVAARQGTPGEGPHRHGAHRPQGPGNLVMTGHTEKFGRCDCGRHVKRGRTECAECRWIRRRSRRRDSADSHPGARSGAAPEGANAMSSLRTLADRTGLPLFTRWDDALEAIRGLVQAAAPAASPMVPAPSARPSWIAGVDVAQFGRRWP